jgi:hypothetical protein
MEQEMASSRLSQIVTGGTPVDQAHPVIRGGSLVATRL